MAGERLYPSSVAFSFISVSPSEWKVDTKGPGPTCPTARRVLERISAAALLVKVIASIAWGPPPRRIMARIRSAITLVLPAPAPAKTKRGPAIDSTAFCCWVFNLAGLSITALYCQKPYIPTHFHQNYRLCPQPSNQVVDAPRPTCV